MFNRKGFTLLELLVVVLIVGILSSVATPQYMKTVDNSRINDGFGRMMMIGTAQKLCWMDNNPKFRTTNCKNEEYYSGTTPVLVSKKYISQESWAASGKARTIYFGTSLYGNNTCKAGGISYSGSAISDTNKGGVQSCMMFSSPNSYGASIGYIDDNNVCVKKTSNSASPTCPS